MHSKNSHPVYSTQPQLTTDTHDAVAAPGSSNISLLIIFTFCIWLLRQQAKD
jgi:hypothetical protein